jgi:hypothetical protein
MLLHIALGVWMGIATFASSAAAQPRDFTPQELKLFELKAQTQELNRKIQELELAKLKREAEDREKRLRAETLIYRHYEESVEKSHSLFGGRTVEEVFRDNHLSKEPLTPDELISQVRAYGAFRLRYQLRVTEIIFETGATDIGQLKADADRLITRFDEHFGDTSIAGEPERYIKAVEAYQKYQLFSKMSEQERMKLVLCQDFAQFLPDCKSLKPLLEGSK